VPCMCGPLARWGVVAAVNLRFCSAEGEFGQNSYPHPALRSGQSAPREYILLCGDDVAGRGFGRAPSWRSASGRAATCYIGDACVDSSRHERPYGEEGSYALTNLAPPHASPGGAARSRL
jgi:hypothetical protein